MSGMKKPASCDIIFLKLGSNLLTENIRGKNAHFLRALVPALIFNFHSIKSYARKTRNREKRYSYATLMSIGTHFNFNTRMDIAFRGMAFNQYRVVEALFQSHRLCYVKLFSQQREMLERLIFI